MVAGFDRYYQIVKCFRDEDLRADRQPEFTQVDCELSFVDQEQVLTIIERVMQRTLQDLVPDYEPVPFARLTHAEAMENYGTDKPDLRYDLKLQQVEAEIFAGCGFQVLEDVLQDEDGAIYAIKAAQCGDKFSRRDFEQLQEVVRKAGGAGLLWIKVQQTLDDASAWQSPAEEISQRRANASIVQEFGVASWRCSVHRGGGMPTHSTCARGITLPPR